MAIKARPTILKELRLHLNMSLDIAAKKLKIDVATLKLWEEEGIEIDIKTARKIAKTYGRPWTILFLENIPHKKTLPKKFRRIYEESLQNEESRKLFEALDNAERIVALAADLEGRKPNWEAINELKNSFTDPVNAALEFRKWIGLDVETQKTWKDKKAGFENWRDLLESKGFYIVEYSFDKKKDGRAFCLTDGEYVVITLNKNDSDAGKTFSLFHEIAHVVLKDDGYFEIFDDNVYNDKTTPEEVFANAFAGNFLVPLGELKNFVNFSDKDSRDKYIKKIARDLCVSEEVIIRRLYDNGFMGESEFKNRRKHIMELVAEYEERQKDKKIFIPKGYHLYQRNEISRNSRGFVLDVFDAYRVNKITYYEVSKYLDTNIKHTPIIESLMSNYG